MRRWAVTFATQHNTFEWLKLVHGQNYSPRYLTSDDILGGREHQGAGGGEEGFYDRQWGGYQRRAVSLLKPGTWESHAEMQAFAESRKGQEAGLLRRAFIVMAPGDLTPEQRQTRTALIDNIERVELRKGHPDALAVVTD